MDALVLMSSLLLLWWICRWICRCWLRLVLVVYEWGALLFWEWKLLFDLVSEAKGHAQQCFPVRVWRGSQLGFERSAASLGTPVSLVACHLGPVPAGRALRFSSGPLRKEGLTFYIRNEVLPLEIWPKIQKIPLPCFLPGGILLLGKQRMHVTSPKERSRGLMMPASALPVIRTDTSELRHESQWPRHEAVTLQGTRVSCPVLSTGTLCGYFSPWFYLHDSQQAGCGENGKTIQTRTLLGFRILSFKCGLQFH